MKERYERTKLEFILFEKEDVIMTSIPSALDEYEGEKAMTPIPRI